MFGHVSPGKVHTTAKPELQKAGKALAQEPQLREASTVNQGGDCQDFWPPKL